MYENVCTIVDSDHIVFKRTRGQDNEPVLGALKRATWTSGHPRVSRPDDGRGRAGLRAPRARGCRARRMDAQSRLRRRLRSVAPGRNRTTVSRQGSAATARVSATIPPTSGTW